MTPTDPSYSPPPTSPSSTELTSSSATPSVEVGSDSTEESSTRTQEQQKAVDQFLASDFAKANPDIAEEVENDPDKLTNYLKQVETGHQKNKEAVKESQENEEKVIQESNPESEDQTTTDFPGSR